MNHTPLAESRCILTPTLGPPRRIGDQQESGRRLLTPVAQEYFPRQRHLGAKVDKRAVDDMPKNCPCEGGRRWVFREFSSLMGMMNLSRGHVPRCLPPTAYRLPPAYNNPAMNQPPAISRPAP